ncbi:MarC family protein [Geoglobus sp.]
MNDPLSFFFAAFTTLFIIVDPPGNIPTFIALTESLNKELIDRISKKATVIATVILLVFVFAGWAVMEFFSISLEALKIAGGLMMFIISIDILFGRKSREFYEEKGKMSAEIDSIAVFPLALPLYSGPGAITAVVVLSSSADLVGKLLIVLAVLLVYAIVRLTHIYAVTLMRVLGKSGSDIIARVMAILLAAISVEYVMDGILSKVGLA